MSKTSAQIPFAPPRHGHITPMDRQAGMTLLEIMISLSLGLLLLTGIGTIYVGSNQTYRVQEDSARLQETGRYAIEIIGRSIRQAGYPATISIDLNQPNFSGTPITGSNGAGSAPDVVTVQYDWTSGERSCDADSTGVAGDWVQNSFNIDTANFLLRCDGEIAAAPGAPGNGSTLVEGVEDLQILYGIDTTGDQSADSYTATPASWGQVVSARICVLARSINQGIAVGNQRYLNCAGALGTASTVATAYTTAADTRLRRPFVATFNLRNRISRLP